MITRIQCERLREWMENQTNPEKAKIADHAYEGTPPSCSIYFDDLQLNAYGAELERKHPKRWEEEVLPPSMAGRGGFELPRMDKLEADIPTKSISRAKEITKTKIQECGCDVKGTHPHGPISHIHAVCEDQSNWRCLVKKVLTD